MRIKSIIARQILDSRGNPTVEADVILENNTIGRAAVPSGASTGSNEALELRDGNEKVYAGKGVLGALANIQNKILPAISAIEVENQEQIDKAMIDLDGTESKSNLGANAILAVSLACAKAAALSTNKPLYEYLHSLSNTDKKIMLPLPMMNIINGGRHADFASDIQEFMIMPVGANTFSQGLQMGAEVFYSLAKILKSKDYTINVGDEGGYAPKLRSGNAEALSLIEEAIGQSGYTLGKDFVFALDVAASELYDQKEYKLRADNKSLSTPDFTNWIAELTNKYPIVSIEDGLAESDWDGWVKLTSLLGNKIQLVGDDLLVTNTKFLQKAIDLNAANAILIKVNQIGTLTETIQAVNMAHKAGWKAIISHRSGETEDTTIAHLAVGLGTGLIKTGSLSRMERVAKYNELLRIEEQLADNAEFSGHVFSQDKEFNKKIN